ncbi:MAG: DNA polymerase III subunit alpha [Candidatus Protistobacter heckmanni]|nr:DNA polymerase III subunit alpha [Candidatus Protistobacter heckmanni]
MTSPRFIHLRLHSEFSVADGIVRLDDAVAAADDDAQPALALTDLANMFGLVKFYKAARDAGVKPIAGVDAWISNPDRPDAPSRLLLLAQNRQGYLNLCTLLSRAWLQNQQRGKAEIDATWFSQPAEAGGIFAEPGKDPGRLCDNLIALSGGMAGDIGAALANAGPEQAERLARRWMELFPGRFYVELQRAGAPGTEAYVSGAVQLAAKLGLPVVATQPAQFMSEDDFTAHEARVCISEGELLANPRRVRRFSREQHFRTQEEMCALFADIPSALANSVEIAKRCNLKLELGKPRLPLFPTPDNMPLDAYLVQQAEQGLAKRMEVLYPDAAQREKEYPRYAERLSFEANTIIKMGFPGYFLIVADFINWAKNNGVPVGPGRGSGAGSLVAYSLGITDLDPLRYNLLFERFLNPERVSMPDFDIDFCQHGRDRVIQYVKEKHGKDAVSQIATFGTMAAKAAVRDVGRVLDLGYNFVDGVAKLIPFKSGKLVTIADAMDEEPLLREREKNEEEVRQLLELAQRLEGMVRNVGMHAGGVLIAPGKLTDFCPLYAQGGRGAEGENDGVVSQYDKDDVEAVGLVKFDFLGLTTLTILDWTERYVRMLDPSKEGWNCAQIPLTDPAAFDILKKANTVAVFQLESRGMQGMLKDAKPDRFEDIIALVALYRPGPMDLIPSFCARKHGREKVEYPDPRVEVILKETYGIMVYQEQVMQMAQIVGGYSLGGADLLRRAMGKKKPEEMAQQRTMFREGAAKGGLNEQKADEIFDLMEKFAGYGFNKSHAAAYALLAYYTAWLKAHHPAEFMAANMSLAMDDTDKVKILFDDCKVNGLKVLPPDINSGAYRFEPVDKKTIRYGLGAVKGTGEAAIEEIIRARKQGGPFADLFDFCARIDRRTVNRRAIEALVRSGAFDGVNADRAVMFASISRAVEAADQADAAANQSSLFDAAFGAGDHKPELAKEPPWSMKRSLQEEKQALGFYLSGHLFDAYREEVRQFAKAPLAQLSEGKDRLIAGIIASTRTQMTQRGKMLVALLDDGSAQMEVAIYNELYEANRAMFRENELLLVRGNVRNDSFTSGLRIAADEVMDITAARSRYGQHVQIALAPGVDLARLRTVLDQYQAREQPGLNLVAEVRTSSSDVCQAAFPQQLRVLPNDDLLRSLRDLLSEGGVRLQY